MVTTIPRTMASLTIASIACSLFCFVDTTGAKFIGVPGYRHQAYGNLLAIRSAAAITNKKSRSGACLTGRMYLNYFVLVFLEGYGSSGDRTSDL